MKTLRAYVALVACGLLLAAGPGKAENGTVAQAQAVLGDAVANFIRPGYAALNGAANHMEKAVSDLCNSPSAQSLASARAGFADFVTAWSRIEIVRFGPVVEDNRLERMLFFPDRRGIGLRQVQAVLAEKDETASNAETLAAKSVALQGLTTLEYLLFGTDAETLGEENPFRCAFTHAVAVRLEAVTDELQKAWDDPQGIAKHLAAPEPSNPDFRTEAESLQAMLGIFVNSSEFLADTRLKPFLGTGPESAKPKRALFWRSGLTGQALSANLEGLEDLYQNSGLERLLSAPTARFGASAVFELANARRLIAAIGQPLAEAATQPENHGRAAYPRIVLLSVRDTFNGRIASGLGLSAGFSSLDGD